MDFIIKGQKLSIDTPLIVAESKKYLTATFTFSDDWEGITERVLHYDNGINVYDKTIGLNGITEADDWQLTDGTWKLYVHGIDGNGRRITTSSVYISVEPFGRFDGEIYPTTPQHVIDQLLLLIKTDGDGTIFLSDDGTYKGVTVSSQEIAEAVERYLETHPVETNWGNISGNIANQTDLAEILADLSEAISSIVVPSALSQLLDDSTHRTVTDAEKNAWNNKQDALVSGTNIKSINGESLLGSGNIVIQGGGGGAVDSVNGKTGTVVLNASDVGALPSSTVIPSALADLSADSTHRTVTDAEKSNWNNKSDFSGDYNDLNNKPTIPSIVGLESASNKVTSLSSASTDTQYPSAKCVYDIVGNIEALLGALL